VKELNGNAAHPMTADDRAAGTTNLSMQPSPR
jgi:hypothetical protein